MPFIGQWLLPSKSIISDGWLAHVDLEQIANGIDIHDVGVHRQHFVDTVNPSFHTSDVEKTDAYQEEAEEAVQDIGWSVPCSPILPNLSGTRSIITSKLTTLGAILCCIREWN